MAKANDNVRYVSKKDVKGKNVTKKVYKVDPTKPHQQRSSGNYVSSNNSAQDYYFHQARRNPHQYLVNYKPVKTGREYYAEQARKNPHEYLTNYEIQPYQSKEEWMAENRNQHKEKRGLLDRLFGTMYYNGIIEGLYNATDNDDSTTFGQGLVEGAKYMNPFENDVSGRITTSDVLRNLGWEDREDGKPNIARGVVGFIGDVLLDPMTYLNPFSSAGKIAKGTGITLDAAKELKALSKAASISDDLAKAEKVGTASGKLRDLPMNDVVNYVRERKPHLNEEQIQVEAERLHDAYARKVYGLRNVDEGADFGIGLSGLPFSSKIKVGDKTLDKFQKSFIKASTLREFGDKTIAPYYNSLTRKLKTSRVGSSLSKTNSMLRTAGKKSTFDSFKEFYLSDLMKGYGKAAKNIEDINTADKLKELFKDATDEDYMRWIKDHEDGIHEAKIKFDRVRLQADEEFIKASEMKEADKKAALEKINAQKKQLDEFEQKADDLYAHLTSDEVQRQYEYANNELRETTSKYQEILQNWIDKETLGEEAIRAGAKADELANSIDDTVNSLNSSIEKANQKIDEVSDLVDDNVTFDSTLSEADKTRYAGIEDEIREVKDAMPRLDNYNELPINDRELFVQNETAKRGIDKFDWTQFFGRYKTNKWGKTYWSELGSSVVNGERYIRIADKRSFVEQLQKMFPEVNLNVNGLGDQLFMDMYTDLLVEDYNEFFSHLQQFMKKESNILSNADEFKLIYDEGEVQHFVESARAELDEINTKIAEAKADKKSGGNVISLDEWNELKAKKKSLEYQLENPANYLENSRIRQTGKGFDRTTEIGRNIRNDTISEELASRKAELDKYGSTYNERQSFDEIYTENAELLNDYADYSYEVFGKTPNHLNKNELIDFFDEAELLQEYAVNGEVDWNGILETFRNGVKGTEYSRIRKKIFDVIEKTQIFNKRSNGSAYDSTVINLMNELGEYGIMFEDASDLATGRLDPYQLANIIWNNSDNSISKMRENLFKSGYTPAAFKKDFLALSHDERMDVLRAYNSNYFDEYGNVFKDVWANAMAKIDGVTINSDLSRFNDYELDVIKRAVRKSWTKKIANYPEDKIDKLNEIAQQLWRDNQRNIKIRTMSAKDDALQTVTNEVNSFKENKLLDEVHDAEFEEKLNKFAEVKDMSPFDREMDFCDMISGSLEYNRWMAENCRLLGDNGAVKADLLDNFEDTEEAIQKYKNSLLAHLKDDSVTREELEEMRNALLDLDNQREKILANASNRGIEFYIPGEFVELQKVKSKEVFELRDRLSDRINWYDDYVNAINSGTIADDFRILGDDIADDFARETDDLASGTRTYDNDGTMYSATEHYSFDRESELQKLQSRIDDAEAFKAKFEADKAEFIRQRKNARQKARYWTNKLEKLQQELVNINIPLEQAKERYRQLVKEASEIPSISQEDIAYLGSRMKQFTKYLNDFEDKTVELNNLRKGIQDVEEQLAASNRELGEIQLRYIESTSDLEIARMLNLNNDFLGRIEDMSKSEWEEVAHTLFADRMEQIASDEAKNGLLSIIQGESHMGGRSYVYHELSEKGREMVGISDREAREGVFNSEWGPRAKSNQRRKFGTIAEGTDVMGEGFYNIDPVELFLTRAIKSNELIHSNEINKVIKDMCEPYTGKKTSDHIVANYIDVNNDLYAGYKEAKEIAESQGAEYTKTFDEFRSEALKKAGIDENMFSANYAYFDILPEQFDVLKREFAKKSKTALYNMDKKLFDTVNQFTELQMKSMKSSFTKVFDGVQRGWKSVNTFINPGFHIQNALSNAFSSMLAIGADAYNVKKINKTLNILRTKDPKQIIKLGGKDYTFKQVADLIEQYGVIDNTFFNKDVMDSLEGVYNFFPFKLGNKVGTTVEGTQRAHLFISALDQGMSPAEAAEMVDKFLFDYADLTHFEQAHLKRIIPFYTFMRKNLPLQLEMMIEKPQVYSNFQKAFREIGQMGEDGEYVEENERNPWRQGDVQLPFKINGRSYGIADQLPYTQLERILDPQKLLGQTSPWLKTPVEMLTNTFLYTGQPIFGDDEESIGTNLLNYAAQQAPYAKMFQNSNKSGKDMEGVTAEEDAATRKKLYILGQLLGFPVNSIDRMYWYDDHGNWAADMFDTPLPQQIQNNMKLKK